MESSTKALSRETPRPSPILEATEWASVEAWLASRVSLDEMARKSGALVRKRVVQNASELLRLVLAYALGDLSLCLVGAWWPLVGSGRLSKTAVRQRLRHCVLWLGQLDRRLAATAFAIRCGAPVAHSGRYGGQCARQSRHGLACPFVLRSQPQLPHRP